MKLTGTNQLKSVRTRLNKTIPPGRRTVSVCGGTGCRAGGSQKILMLLQNAVAEKAIDVTVKETGCHGLCEKGPLMVIRPDNIFYQNIKPSDIDEIVERTLADGEIIERLLYEDPETGLKIRKENDIPFYSKQVRHVLEQNGRIDPKCIEDYIAAGGYSALAAVLTGMSPAEVLEEVEKSGLRGRGGGGFPTGRKWKSCRNAAGNPKYVICNADEGDPGAYMDRSLLEGNPHSVIEGMIIGAFAIGAAEGRVYVRAEYPLAVENILKAVADAREWGLLGENILGTGMSFDIRVTRGGGAFVCGESTALMQSLQGFSGEPRTKHIHTVENGLYNLPTNLNNVETWANIPIIINRGSSWYSSIGTPGSSGTKIFSLVGKVRNTGLIEVPMGITLREIIFGIGGGIPKNKKFKAIQTGGPSGGCIPEEYLDRPVDFDELSDLGSMMGSGGLIVMDEDTSMVEVARFYMKFLVEESCGKCTPCREGLWQLLSILNRIADGEGTEGDLEAMEEMAEMIRDSSLCALGKTAPNPVLSTIKYFRDEYLNLINTGKKFRTESGRLYRYKIDTQMCTSCALCQTECPHDAIANEHKEVLTIDTGRCMQCGICFDVCSFDAVKRVSI